MGGQWSMGAPLTVYGSPAPRPIDLVKALTGLIAGKLVEPERVLRGLAGFASGLFSRALSVVYGSFAVFRTNY